ncbi:VC0807 family protein [Labedaea rhizosphaerae]|uniref:Intracellular septation protein A n=1 Tax=Labedaea rhizosphaerae TaxID=598644 RepID=A0A4R6SK89_LABRH|nr:VC0807 family protein [Labedaea rhizosphaerae]TDQ01369.1 hypothetical protein EV186_1021237 [Labedaea rhizosphaerae]
MGIAVGDETRVATGKRKRGVLGSWLALVLDGVIPLAGYYLLRHYGMSMTMALALTSVVPALRVIWVAVRERSTEPLATAVLLVTVISIPIALIGGSPRLLLAKESIGTGPVGLWVIVSALRGKGAMTEPYRAFLVRSARAADAWDRLVAGNRRFQRSVRSISLVWGIALVVAFAVHLLLAMTLPIDTAVWATGLVVPAMVVVASICTGPITGYLQDELKKGADA